jgi:diadenosine tetraphosphate (Ap4A) HIT family hydrolase
MNEINKIGKKFENEYCIGVPSFNANRKTLIGSYVVIPKSHAKSPFELTLDEWIATKDLIDKIKQYIDAEYNPDGYNLGWNVGDVAGQEVEYAHLHIIHGPCGKASSVLCNIRAKEFFILFVLPVLTIFLV